jgi:hypothetical protein
LDVAPLTLTDLSLGEGDRAQGAVGNQPPGFYVPWVVP